MSIYKKFIFSVCGILLLASCQDLKMNDYSSMMKSMTETIDSILVDIHSIDAIEITNSIQFLQNEMSIYQRSKWNDTISLIQAYHLDSIKQTYLNYDFVKRASPILEQNLLECKSQILKLEYDIEKRIGNREKYEEWILIESNNFQQLKADFTVIKDKLDSANQMMKHLTK